MNRILGGLPWAALVSGLWLPAVPAIAGPINWYVGLNVQTVSYGYGPSIVSGAGYYNSSNAAPFGGDPAGVTLSSNDPASVLSYAPNPSLAGGGLTGGSLGLTGSGAQAYAAASLATGTTNIDGLSSYLVYSNPNLDTEANAAAEAILQDQLTFFVGGTGSATIQVGFSLEGATSYSTMPPDESSYSQTISFDFGGGIMGWADYSPTWSGSTATNNPPTTTALSGWNTSSFGNDTATGFLFTATLTVTNGEVVPFYLSQQLNCNDGATCSYQDTGQVSLVLPSGVSYTSASGVFLTQTSSTPEPSSLMLIGLGFAALGCAWRRRSAG